MFTGHWTSFKLQALRASYLPRFFYSAHMCSWSICYTTTSSHHVCLTAIWLCKDLKREKQHTKETPPEREWLVCKLLKSWNFFLWHYNIDLEWSIQLKHRKDSYIFWKVFLLVYLIWDKDFVTKILEWWIFLFLPETLFMWLVKFY